MTIRRIEVNYNVNFNFCTCCRDLRASFTAKSFDKFGLIQMGETKNICFSIIKGIYSTSASYNFFHGKMLFLD